MGANYKSSQLSTPVIITTKLGPANIDRITDSSIYIKIAVSLPTPNKINVFIDGELYTTFDISAEIRSFYIIEITGLNPGTKYRITYSFVFEDGTESPQSTTLDITTTPGRPTNIQVTCNFDQNNQNNPRTWTITWDMVPGADEYQAQVTDGRIYRAASEFLNGSRVVWLPDQPAQRTNIPQITWTMQENLNLGMQAGSANIIVRALCAGVSGEASVKTMTIGAVPAKPKISNGLPNVSSIREWFYNFLGSIGQSSADNTLNWAKDSRVLYYKIYLGDSTKPIGETRTNEVKYNTNNFAGEGYIPIEDNVYVAAVWGDPDGEYSEIESEAFPLNPPPGHSYIKFW